MSRRTADGLSRHAGWIQIATAALALACGKLRDGLVAAGLGGACLLLARERQARRRLEDRAPEAESRSPRPRGLG